MADLFPLMKTCQVASGLYFGMYPELTSMLLWTLAQWLIGCNSKLTYLRDAKSSLAVLHNQNDMVTHFKASSWVSEAQGAVVSRGVTTCAGMTTHTVIVAQTKVGFLTGGRRASFHALSQEEQDIQLEEAYGRATVALTRARSLCIIMGPLDMNPWCGYCHSTALLHPTFHHL